MEKNIPFWIIMIDDFRYIIIFKLLVKKFNLF